MSLAKKILNEIGTKKILKFLLPHDDKYTISDYFVNPNEHSLCDNCKKRIVYAVEIKNAKGKQFKVGLDCAETLSSLDAIKLGQIRQNFKAIINILKTYHLLRRRIQVFYLLFIIIQKNCSLV